MIIGKAWPDIESISEEFHKGFVELFRYTLAYSGDNTGESWSAATLLREEFHKQQTKNIELLKNNEDIKYHLSRLGILQE